MSLASCCDISAQQQLGVLNLQTLHLGQLCIAAIMRSQAGQITHGAKLLLSQPGAYSQCLLMWGLLCCFVHYYTCASDVDACPLCL